MCSCSLTEALIQAGDFAGGEPVCAAALAASRDAGDLFNLPELLYRMALLDLRAGRAGDAAAHLREALRLALRTGTVEREHPGLLRVPVRRDRTPRRGRHHVGRVGRAQPARGLARGRTPPGRAAARRPAGAGTGPGAGGRGTRRGDELGHRRRVHSPAHRGPRPAAGPGGAGPGHAQRPGTGAGHPGRPRAGPSGQIAAQLYISVATRSARTWSGSRRLPPPRRPDPPGPDRRTDLSSRGRHPAQAPAGEAICGSFDPGRRRAQKGVS